MFPAQGQGGGVHHAQALGQRLVVGDAFVAHCIFMLDRIPVVHAIDLGGLEHQIRANLQTAQAGGGVGGKEWIAGAGRENHHAPGGKMRERGAPRVSFDHAGHGQPGKYRRRHCVFFQCILQGECVHNGRQHAHVVGLRAIHALGADRDAAKEITAAHHQCKFDASRQHRADVRHDARQHRAIDAEGILAHQRLAAQLEQDAAIGRALGLLRGLAGQGISLP